MKACQMEIDQIDQNSQLASECVFFCICFQSKSKQHLAIFVWNAT